MSQTCQIRKSIVLVIERPPGDGPPLFDLSLVVRAKSVRSLLGRARENLLADVSKAFAHSGISQCVHHRRIDFGDDLSGRPLRCPEPVPEVDVKHLARPPRRSWVRPEPKAVARRLVEP